MAVFTSVVFRSLVLLLAAQMTPLVAQISTSKDFPGCSVSFPIVHEPSTPPVKLHLEEKKGKIVAKTEWSQPQVGPGYRATFRCPHGGPSSLLLGWSGLSSQVARGLSVAGIRMVFPTSVGMLRRDHSPWESVNLFQKINAHSTLHVAIKN